MNKYDFLRLTKKDIVSGWPTSNVSPMPSGWSRSVDDDLFILRFKAADTRIRVEISLRFYEDIRSTYPLLFAEGQVAGKSQIEELRRALDEREWEYLFDDNNKICVVKFT
jgi:hypothetical protein